MRTYWGGCDWDWGLSYGFKNPDLLCFHDPRPKPTDTPSAAATPSASATSSPSAKPSSAPSHPA
ncbi:hypothetical protein J0670_27150, partial [Streptomyces sp. FH025]|nr:hypothetical protein [Streptomyces sp. FH025]